MIENIARDNNQNCLAMVQFLVDQETCDTKYIWTSFTGNGNLQILQFLKMKHIIGCERHLWSLAIVNKYDNIFEWLCCSHAEIWNKWPEILSLALCALKSRRKNILTFILREKQDYFNVKSGNGMHIWESAVKLGFLDMVQLLHDILPTNDRNLLTTAYQRKHSDIFKYLVENCDMRLSNTMAFYLDINYGCVVVWILNLVDENVFQQ